MASHMSDIHGAATALVFSSGTTGTWPVPASSGLVLTPFAQVLSNLWLSGFFGLDEGVCT
jgi:hypothetical protein